MSTKINDLTEVKKGKSGKGLLIENDGYVISTKESLQEGIHTNSDEWYVPYPFIVSAVFQKFGIKNANGRIYPEDILKREVERYQTKIKERRALGECCHPEQSTIDLGRVSHNITELHWEGSTLVGKMEIFTSYGFRKFGIVSTLGDMVANHILSGNKIGVSSRAVGSVEERLGTLVVGDDLELLCWDVVADPSTPNAWIFQDEREKDLYVENKMKNNNFIDEKINKINKILL